MKIQLEPQDIDAIAQRVVELMKPFLVRKEEAIFAVAPTKPKGDYMTIPQLAEYLQIKKSTIYSWTYQRRFPIPR